MRQAYDWYKTLRKPAWAPTPPVFGKVWSVLYPIIIVTFGYVFYQAFQGNLPWSVTSFFLANLIFNVIYTPIQFGLHDNRLALADILLVWISLLGAIMMVWPYSPIIGTLQLPYLIWVSIATVLQYQITRLNQPSSRR